MADLISAASKRLQYASNELGSGDKDAALGHLVKAQEYTARAAAQIAPPTPENPDVDVDEPLSSDPSVAIHQLLARYGHPTRFNEAGESIASDPASVLADTPDNGRELALLGYFGVGPGRFAGADHSLRDEYYTNDGATPKDPDVNAWAAYLARQ